MGLEKFQELSLPLILTFSSDFFLAVQRKREKFYGNFSIIFIKKLQRMIHF